MSRSFHETKRGLADLEKADFSDPSTKGYLVDSYAEALSKKRATKRNIRTDRTSTDVDFSIQAPPVVRFLDETEYVHYLVTADDAATLIEQLPRGIMFGLSEIVFQHGLMYMAESVYNTEGAERDPFTGRLGEKISNQVYVPPVLGTYFSRTNTIALYSYVYSRSEIKHPQLLFLCKIRMLCTLLHEIAHHDDHMRRTRRGRWLGLWSDKTEDYAHKMERQWIDTCLPSFLNGEYPAETNDLLSWLAEIVGFEISLPDILFMTLLGSGWDAITKYIDSDRSNSDSLFELAHDFHLNGQYEVCLRCCDAMLTAKGEHIDAMCLKADTLMHLSKHDEAEKLLATAMQIDPKCFKAIDLKCDILRAKEDWLNLLASTELALTLVEPRLWYVKFSLQVDRLIAYVFLRDVESARQICRSIEDRGSYRTRKAALMAFLDLLDGNIASAVLASETILLKERGFGFEKSVAHFTHTTALNLLNKRGNFYRAPKRMEQVVESLALKKAVSLHVEDNKVLTLFST